MERNGHRLGTRNSGRGTLAGQRKGVARIFPLRIGDQDERLRQLGREVLQAVDGGIGTTGEQRLFELLHENALAAHLGEDRKSTRLNSSHVRISYAVFCLKKKTINSKNSEPQRTFK